MAVAPTEDLQRQRFAMPSDVFISYSTRDNATADAVCHALEGAGIRCWIAPRDAARGRQQQGSIVRGLRECRVMVLIFSAASNESERVTREVGIAADLGKPVVPFRIDAAEMNDDLYFYISSVHWLDALGPPMERHIDRLVQAVAALVPPSPPASREEPGPRPASPSARRRIVGLAGGVGIAALLLIGYLVHVRADRGAGPAWAPPAPGSAELAHVDAVNAGVRAYRAGDVAGAVRHWQQATEAYDGRHEAHLYLAGVYVQEERHDEAIAAYRAALAALGRLPDGGPTGTEAAEKDELRVDALHRLGTLEFDTGQYPAAVRTFHRLAELRPGDARGWNNYLNALYAQQRWEDIVPAGERLLELDPLNDNAHLILALAFRETGEAERALGVLDRRGALPVHLRDLQLGADSDRVTLRGTVVGNGARPGARVRLEFTFFGPSDAVLGTDTLVVSAPAPEATGTVRLDIGTGTMPTGFRYRVLD